ncbi:MAG: hypothetical protein P1V97_22800 [Planctomycetota bacterium]|nr:hypothetical protein [Planctomycetota bacterium]
MKNEKLNRIEDHQSKRLKVSPVISTLKYDPTKDPVLAFYRGHGHGD